MAPTKNSRDTPAVFVPAECAEVDFGANTFASSAIKWKHTLDGIRVDGSVLSTATSIPEREEEEDPLDGDRGSAFSVLVTEVAGVTPHQNDDLDADEHREDMVAALATTVCNDEPTALSALEDFLDEDFLDPLEDTIEGGTASIPNDVSANGIAPRSHPELSCEDSAAMDVDGCMGRRGAVRPVSAASAAQPSTRPPTYVVDHFIAVTQFSSGSGHARHWLVKWRGYELEQATWEAETKAATGLLKSLSKDDMLELVEKFSSEVGQDNVRAELGSMNVDPADSGAIFLQWELHRKSTCKCHWKTTASKKCSAVSSLTTRQLAAVTAHIESLYNGGVLQWLWNASLPSLRRPVRCRHPEGGESRTNSSRTTITSSS